MHILGKNSIDLIVARDISSTGLGVYVPHRFEGCDVDEGVELVISLPHQTPFAARGVIKHRSEDDELSPFFGVEFTELSDNARDQLAVYLSGLPDREDSDR